MLVPPRCVPRPGRAGRRCRCQSALELLEPGIPEPRPHLLLPATVERLDPGLEADLVRGDEDGHHVDGQAEPDHRADRVGVGVTTDEATIVVELGIARPTHRAPVLGERIDRRCLRGDRSSARRTSPPWRLIPVKMSSGMPPLSRSPSMTSKPSSSARSRPDIWELPPGRGARAADPAPAIERSLPVEDSAMVRTDGTAEGSSRASSSRGGSPLVRTRRGRLLAEPAAEIEDQVLDLARCPLDEPYPMRLVVPVDIVERATLGPDQCPGCTVPRPTPNCRATTRWAVPDRTASTSARRRSAITSARVLCPLHRPRSAVYTERTDPHRVAYESRPASCGIWPPQDYPAPNRSGSWSDGAR